jgi:hypothetical protein
MLIKGIMVLRQRAVSNTQRNQRETERHERGDASPQQLPGPSTCSLRRRLLLASSPQPLSCQGQLAKIGAPVVLEVRRPRQVPEICAGTANQQTETAGAGGSNGGGNEGVWRQTESGSEGEITDGGALREKIEKGGTAMPKERYCRSSDQQNRGGNGGRNWQLER